MRLRTRKKISTWNKREERNRILCEKEDLRIQNYKPSTRGLSIATQTCRVLNPQHPGKDVFFEMAAFLGEMHPTENNFNKMYEAALHYTFRKAIFGRVHYTETSRKKVTTQKDVVQMMRECLRASGISRISVKDFLKKEILA